MIVKMFKRRFAPLVESGDKGQTVRPEPKRMPKVGESISLREWRGRPYRSKQRILGEGIITGVRKISICENLFWMEFGDQGRGVTVTDRYGLDHFAKDDGFNDWSDLVAWFQGEHGLPFAGIIIFWKLCNTESKSDATLPPIGQSSETPRGLGRDGNKPLMRNRTGPIALPSPIAQLAATFSNGGSR